MTSSYASRRYVDNAQQVAVKREKSAVLLVTRCNAIYVGIGESVALGIPMPGDRLLKGI
jgi:hypothetical protein